MNAAGTFVGLEDSAEVAEKIVKRARSEQVEDMMRDRAFTRVVREREGHHGEVVDHIDVTGTVERRPAGRALAARTEVESHLRLARVGGDCSLRGTSYNYATRFRRSRYSHRRMGGLAGSASWRRFSLDCCSRRARRGARAL